MWINDIFTNNFRQFLRQLSYTRIVLLISQSIFSMLFFSQKKSEEESFSKNYHQRCL